MRHLMSEGKVVSAVCQKLGSGEGLLKIYQVGERRTSGSVSWLGRDDGGSGVLWRTIYSSRCDSCYTSQGSNSPNSSCGSDDLLLRR